LPQRRKFFSSPNFSRISRFFQVILIVSTIIFSLTGPALAQNKKAQPRQFVIKKIIVQGNSYFSAKKIKSQTSYTKSWINIFSRPKIFPRRIEENIFAIDSLYHVHGFWEATSSIDYEVDTLDKKATVWIKIYEGVQTRLNNLTVSGGIENLNNKSRKSISSLKWDSPLNKSKLAEIMFEIKAVYANNGYPYAEIDPLIVQSEDKKLADVILEISSGDLVTFGEVELQGFKLTQPHVGRRELTFKKGETYKREKVITSQQRLYSTGLFNYLSLEAKDAKSKPRQPNFILRVIERKRNYISFKVAAGQDSLKDLTADFLGEWGNKNLWGSGKKFSFSASSRYAIITKLQNIKNRFKISLTEPWFLGTRTPLNLEFFYDPGVKSVIQPYRIEEFGANVSLTREIRKTTRVWVGGSFQQITIFDISPADEILFRREKGINERRKVSLGFENDTRSNIFIPLGGSLSQIYLEYVGGVLGGDNNFFKMVGSWSRYFEAKKLKKFKVWAARLKLGYIKDLPPTNYIPTFDRFYMGGASSIRGYVENSIGARDSLGTPLGGNVLGLANLEYRADWFWKFGWNFFVDYGNIWSEAEHISFRNARLTAGVGIQYFSPLGPIRLDYGRKLLRGEKPLTGGRLHLSLLYSF